MSYKKNAVVISSNNFRTIWSLIPMYMSHSSDFDVFVYVKLECGSNMDDVLLFNHTDSCFRHLSDKEEQRNGIMNS